MRFFFNLQRLPNIAYAILLIFLSLTSSAYGQQKVANYFFGKAGTNSYENFSFWVEASKRGEITYSYGRDRKEVKLNYLGKDNYKGEPCFKVQFPNSYVLYIIPKGLSLKVASGDGKYTKVFRWEYEGPVNGIGTFCTVCAEDENESMELIRKYYLK